MRAYWCIVFHFLYLVLNVPSLNLQSVWDFRKTPNVTLEHKSSHNTVWVKILHFSFMPKIIISSSSNIFICHFTGQFKQLQPHKHTHFIKQKTSQTPGIYNNSSYTIKIHGTPLSLFQKSIYTHNCIWNKRPRSFNSPPLGHSISPAWGKQFKF